MNVARNDIGHDALRQSDLCRVEAERAGAVADVKDQPGLVERDYVLAHMAVRANNAVLALRAEAMRENVTGSKEGKYLIERGRAAANMHHQREADGVCQFARHFQRADADAARRARVNARLDAEDDIPVLLDNARRERDIAIFECRQFKRWSNQADGGEVEQGKGAHAVRFGDIAAEAGERIRARTADIEPCRHAGARRDLPFGRARQMPAGPTGDRVSFVVKSDVSDEIHVHGYDFHKNVKAGGNVSLSFPAKIDGEFVIELESRGEQIASLVVNP